MSKIETLVCTANAEQPHEFTRERKRGVKPSICPDCKTAREIAQAEAVAERAEAAHLIGGIITVAAVRAIQAYRAWLKDDAMLFRALNDGEITRDEWLEMRTGCPDVNGPDMPSSETWRAAEAANLI